MNPGTTVCTMAKTMLAMLGGLILQPSPRSEVSFMFTEICVKSMAQSHWRSPVVLNLVVLFERNVKNWICLSSCLYNEHDFFGMLGTKPQKSLGVDLCAPLSNTSHPEASNHSGDWSWLCHPLAVNACIYSTVKATSTVKKHPWFIHLTIQIVLTHKTKLAT